MTRSIGLFTESECYLAIIWSINLIILAPQRFWTDLGCTLALMLHIHIFSNNHYDLYINNPNKLILKQWVALKASSDWLVKLRITREKWRPRLFPWQVKKSSTLICCGVYYLYLTVLVYTKTTIHLSVSRQRRIVFTASHLQFGEIVVNYLFFQEGTVTNPAIWLVLSAVRIFLSLTTVMV